ncbi:MAG: hypothetical protein RR198_06450 [Oscillospiraceae bacterium]
MSMPVIVPGTVTRAQAISDVIESVALEQTGLSHVLNAEGEKIQAIVKIGTVDQMLAANKSVKHMVDAVSRLELVLQSKLEMFECEICPK